MCEIVTSVEFWKFAAPLFGAIVAWFVNEWRKRIWEQYQRKEESYKELLRCLQGFYVGASDASELKTEFINQLNKSWLYCPDDTIKKGYAFLESTHRANPLPDELRTQAAHTAMGDFVASIRSDLLSRKLVKSTNLTGKDFKHLKAN